MRSSIKSLGRITYADCTKLAGARLTLVIQIVHVPTFEAQYTALKGLIEQNRSEEIDTAWLSLHFMVKRLLSYGSNKC